MSEAHPDGRMHPARHRILRVREETRLRKLTVASIEDLTPHMRRIHFASDELHDFVSRSPDDHCKLLLPDGSGSTCKRDYTPRAFDAAAGTLTIDFALHEAGPATGWALQAQPGDLLEIGGPRGSVIVEDDFDWYWLVGDETALPAIGRRVEALRQDVPVTSIVVVDGPDDVQHFETRAAWRPIWVFRAGSPMDDADLLRSALRECTLPAGEGFVWIAAEASAARQTRHYITETLRHPPAWMKAAGYWVRGEAGAPSKLPD